MATMHSTSDLSLVAVSPETGLALGIQFNKMDNSPVFLSICSNVDTHKVYAYLVVKTQKYTAICVVSRDALALHQVKMMKDIFSAKKDKYTTAFFASYYYLFLTICHPILLFGLYVYLALKSTSKSLLFMGYLFYVINAVFQYFKDVFSKPGFSHLEGYTWK